jgi:hypothetical protein
MKVLITNQLCIFDDDADIENLSVCTQPSGYKVVVYTAGPNKGKRYARIYSECPDNLEVDHINGNTLDNRRSNLRHATSQQNKFNRKSQSKLPKGVEKRGSSFRVTICINYTKYNLGTFDSVEKAENAYKQKAAEWFGAFAKHLSEDIG